MVEHQINNMILRKQNFYNFPNTIKEKYVLELKSNLKTIYLAWIQKKKI